MKKLILISTLIMGFSAWAQDDLDDVEADMETAISESEAAESLAKDQEKMAREEEKRAEVTRKEAESAQARARVREETAKAEIAALEKRITGARAKAREHLEKKKVAETRIMQAEKKTLEKKDLLAKVEAERDAAREERARQEDVLAQKVNERKKLEEEIVQNRESIGRMQREMADYKAKTQIAEQNLVKLRANARKEAERKMKLQGSHEEAKRKLSSVPSKVFVRSAKYDCEATNQPGDGAKNVGGIKKGSKYELYRVVNKRWVEMQLGANRVYAPKTCF